MNKANNETIPDFYGRFRKVDRFFAALMLALFLYNLLVWLRVIGDGSAWRPGQGVLLSGALLLQALASLVLPKSRPAFYAMLLASLGLLYFAVFR